MTDLLKDLLNDRADSLPAPQLDVLAMVREGDRRSRRRSAVLGAGVAAAVVAAVAIPSAAHHDVVAHQRAEQAPFAAAFTAHEPSYAIGSEVHVDGRTFDVGHEVVAMVPTTAGVVFADKAGTVWASDGTDTVEIGTADAKNPRLEADGARVAWIEERAGGPLVFTVLDQSTGETLITPVNGGADGPTEYAAQVFAVDGTDVYFRDSRGIVRWNVETGEQVSLDLRHDLELFDVKSSVLAEGVPDSEGGPASTNFGRPSLASGTGSRETPSRLQRTFALSPDGRWAIGEETDDQSALADTTTGAVTPIDVPGYAFFAGYGWVDSDTFVGLGLNRPWDSTPVDLIECTVGGGCTVTGVAVGRVADGLVLPVGEPSER